MDTLSKVCRRCNVEKPLTEFYKRPNSDSPTSECKSCMSSRSKSAPHQNNKDYLVPRAATETLVINYLHSKGIPALPGKALRHSHVDIIAFGCVDIEVKYSKLKWRKNVQQFMFNATYAQQNGGFRAQIVLLVCDYGDKNTFHLFDVTDPVFFIHGRVKIGMTFTPGNYEALKHGNNRVVMVQGMMDESQDKLSLIYEKLGEYCALIKKGA